MKNHYFACTLPQNLKKRLCNTDAYIPKCIFLANHYCKLRKTSTKKLENSEIGTRNLKIANQKSVTYKAFRIMSKMISKKKNSKKPNTKPY